MKIAFIVPSLSQRGPIIVVRDIVDKIICKGEDEICVFYFDDIIELKFSCEVKRIEFTKKINFDDFDIIHSHGIRPDLYVFINKILGNIKRAKTVSTLHQYNYIQLKFELKNKWKAYIASNLWNLFLSKHDLIICLSRDMKKYYESQIFINSNKLRYVYNGRPNLKLNNFNSSYEIFNKIPKDYIVLGTSCLITKRKGLEQVIKVLPDMPNLYFVIVGNGEEEKELKFLTHSLNVENRCVFLGFQKNPIEYYKYFDIFILPSRAEGFPLSLIEAASAKKAIIVSNLDVFKEIFTENEVSFFTLDNLEDLKNKIIYTYNNKINFENNVYKAFLDKYTSDIMANNYLRLYLQLLKN